MMDPVTMILAFALKNPQVTSDAARNYSQPGQVDAQNLNLSVADFAMETLNCYHKTATFRGVEVLGTGWKQQDMYGAKGSVVIRITFIGRSGTPYQMIVAAMAKEQAYRVHVLQENSFVPYNKNCALEHWIQLPAS